MISSLMKIEQGKMENELQAITIVIQYLDFTKKKKEKEKKTQYLEKLRSHVYLYFIPLIPRHIPFTYPALIIFNGADHFHHKCICIQFLYILY